jgi:hypothetical protein
MPDEDGGSGGTSYGGVPGGVGGAPKPTPTPAAIAKLVPAPGAPCAGSDSAGIVLDSQLPLGSEGKTNDVTNIYQLWEPATIGANGIPGGNEVVGWVAQTPSNYFVISNGRDPSLPHNLAQQVPVLGQVWTAAANSQADVISPPLTASQANSVFLSYPNDNTKGNGSQSCFTTGLPETQWT